MKVVAKVKCICGRWIRVRDNAVPTHVVSCWNCSAEIQLTWVNKQGGNAKITKSGVSKTVYDVDIESLELP